MNVGRFKMKLILFAFLAAAAFAVTINGRILVRRSTSSNTYKMCVPVHLMSSCEQMSKQDTKSSAQIICIPARDRIECIEKINEKQADFVVVDPEDMYIAKNINPNNDNELAIFEEIRTREEPEAEFRYEGVAVVHKDLPIKSIQDIKGLKSCHTGVGRNVGYKIPLTKLRQMGVIGLLNEQGLSARENELKAFSNLFSKACIVGDWSPDQEINKQFKERYSNLCALCEDPIKCDYPDKFSGYDGALRCLTQNGGQIAWTKVIYVRKFFGLAVGSNPAVSAESDQPASDYSYLCPDGSRVPVTSSSHPCRWAARPWQGYMANAAVVKTIDELRAKIEQLNSVGNKGKQHWLKDVLELSDAQLPVANKMISPGDYLDKGNYTDVIERDYGPPVKAIRMCVTTEDEFSKCADLSRSAFTRNIRPRLQCSRLTNVQACMKLVRDNGADIMKLDAGLVNIGQEMYNLKPIVREEYLKEKLDKYYAVAVVRKNSNINSFKDLKSAKSCHMGYGTSAGYNAVIHTLLQLKLIESKCPQVQELAKFFSGGSCLPDVRIFHPDLDADVMKALYSVCGGEGDAKVDLYRGYTGALRCLVEGNGDVAFISHLTVPQNADGNNRAQWASELKSTDYELLCPNGGRAAIDQYERCNMMQTPPHMVVTSNLKNNDDISEMQHAILEMGELYAKRPDLFRMFGNYNGKPDVLFKNAATGLKAIHGKPNVPEGYAQMLDEVNACN